MLLYLANAPKGTSLREKILAVYIDLKLIQFTGAVIHKSPSCSSPRLHLEQFKQRQETPSLDNRADGRFIGKRYRNNSFLSVQVFCLVLFE